jgi:hypothetical protein
MISRISKAGVRVSTPGSWYEVGYGGGDSKGVTKARGFDEVFPLKDGEMYQVVSRLDGQGGYELTIDEKLVATAQVTAASPLSLEKKSGGSDFKGNELPLRWAAGHAAVLVGPMDRGVNVCRQIRFWPAVQK